MIGPDELADVEGDSAAVLHLANVDPDAPVHPRELAHRLEIDIEDGADVRLAYARESNVARVKGRWKIYLYSRMSRDREAWLLGHEIGHWYYQVHRRHVPNEEARCDAMGACLLAPRRAFARAASVIGESIKELADLFGAPLALTFLRIGEVTGRPVLLLHERGHIARGDAFEWGSQPLRLPRSVAHPVRVGGRWGAMADRGWRATA